MPQTASVHIQYIQYMMSLARDFIWLGSIHFWQTEIININFFTLPWDTTSQKSGIP